MAWLYSVKNWDELFETAESRRIKGALSWVATPTKHDGLGYRRTMRLPNAGDMFSAWNLILQVAAKCKLRGVLADANGPFGPADMQDKTGFGEKHFDAAFNLYSSQQIGWLSREDYETSTIRLRLQDSTGQDTTGQDNDGAADAAARDESEAALRDWLAWWNTLKSDSLVPQGLNVEEPSQGVRAGWKRVQRSPKLRKLLADRDAIVREIRESPFCREPWFCLEKLFGGKNRSGEWILVKLLEGAYRAGAPAATQKPQVRQFKTVQP